MLCHPEPHPAVNYALRNAKSRITAPSLFVGLALLLIAALVLVLRRKKDTAADDA